MWIRFLARWIATMCVSYILIQVLFAACTILIEYIGPVTPQTSLLLLLMCLLIAVWTSLLREKTWKRSGVFYLLCYAGCLAVVLGIGEMTGFIPLEEGDAATNWTVVAMITAVFIGTLAFSIIWDKGTAAKINARLDAMRRPDAEHPRSPAGEKKER